jgi:small subunit ribosomal protein S20
MVKYHMLIAAKGVKGLANIKSAEKRARIAKIRTLRNKSYKSSVKTTIKKFELALEAGNIDDAKAAFVKAEKQLDKAVSKGIIHKNTAARKKSQLASKLNKAI